MVNRGSKEKWESLEGVMDSQEGQQQNNRIQQPEPIQITPDFDPILTGLVQVSGFETFFENYFFEFKKETESSTI